MKDEKHEKPGHCVRVHEGDLELSSLGSAKCLRREFPPILDLNAIARGAT